MPTGMPGFDVFDKIAVHVNSFCIILSMEDNGGIKPC